MTETRGPHMVCLIDGVPASPVDPHVPVWSGGFCERPGLYETLRWSRQARPEWREVQTAWHYRRLLQGLRTLSAEPSSGWGGLDAIRQAAPLEAWREWTNRAVDLSSGGDGGGAFRVRWQVLPEPNSFLQDGGGMLRQIVFSIPQDSTAESADAAGHALLSRPPGVGMRRVGDLLWTCKRCGPPVTHGETVAADAADWNRTVARSNRLLKKRSIRAVVEPSGAFLVQRDDRGRACETTWGALFWVEPGRGGTVAAGGRVVVPGEDAPRLPSVTLRRVMAWLGGRGPWSLQRGGLHPGGDHGKGGFFAVASSVRGVVPMEAWLADDGSDVLWRRESPLPLWLGELQRDIDAGWHEDLPEDGAEAGL